MDKAAVGVMEPLEAGDRLNALAFDRAAATLLSFAENVRDTTPEHQQAIVWHFVERVVISDREVVSISVRPEAKPYFEDFPVSAVVMAPPDSANVLHRGTRCARDGVAVEQDYPQSAWSLS